MNKELIERAANSYAAITRPSFVNGEFDRNAIVDAFEHAAQWRINSVWHDADERPEIENEPFLVECKSWVNDRVGYIVYDDIKDYYRALKNHGNFFTVLRWAYIYKLLPDKKDLTECTQFKCTLE